MIDQPSAKCLFKNIFIMFLMVGFVLPAHAVISIANDESPKIVKSMEYLIIDQVTADEDMLPSYLKNQDWTLFDPSNITDIPLNSAMWLKFQIEAKDALDDKWLLVIRMATLQRARMFTENTVTGEIWSSKPIGLHYDFEDRYEKSRHLAFPTDVEADQVYNVYIEVATTHMLLAPLMLIKQSEFRAGNTLDLIAMGLVVGALAIMLLYNTGLFSILREKTYFFYCVYVLSALLYILFLTGIAPIYIWPDKLFLVNNGAFVFASATFLTATIFFRNFLNLAAYGGWVIALNSFIVVSWSIIIFLFIFFENRYLGSLVGAFAMITSVIGVVISVYLALKQNRLAIIYLVSWAFLMWGTLIFTFMIRGYLEYNLVTAYSQMLGMILELVLLSYALAYRINLDREQTAIAQDEALVLAKRVSTERRRRIVAQEETLSLQRNINEKLEKQVDLRTKQYEEAMDKLEVANADLVKLSLTDQLSQVFNRRGFDEAIINECNRARREKQSLAVIIVDIDHFKNINDSYGHTVGDTCIKEIAALLKGVVKRSSDMVARYGGEEFVYLLPNTSLSDAKLIAEKARSLIEALTIETEGYTLNITASFGAASWVPVDDEDYQLLIKAADKALYHSKEHGRNQVSSCERDAIG